MPKPVRTAAALLLACLSPAVAPAQSPPAPSPLAPSPLAPSPAVTAPACAPAEAILRHLEARYGETPRSLGLSAGGRLMLLLANEETGSWTVVLQSPGGPACIADSGEGYEALKPATPRSGA